MRPSRVRRLTGLALAGLVGWTVAGCYVGGSGTTGDAGANDADGPPACPSDLPGSCPGPAPSYPNEVAPLVATRCATCHAPGGIESNHDYTTYDGVYVERTTILTQVYGCRMPPPTASPLATDERAVLLQWLVCGAPSQ